MTDEVSLFADEVSLNRRGLALFAYEVSPNRWGQPLFAYEVSLFADEVSLQG